VVPWVAVLEKGRYVASLMSVAICFGRTGNGAVAGLMQPSSSGLIGSVVPVNRSSAGKIEVDVDGNNHGTQYNDRFINPKEFLASDMIIQHFVEHLHKSLNLLQRLK